LDRHCYWLSDWALLVTLMAQCTDLPCVAGGNPSVRSKNISTPLTAFTGLDGSGQWLGLLGHRTSHHIKALIYTSPVDSEEDLIARIVEAAATIRQQPGTFAHIELSVLCRCRLSIEVVGHTFEYLL
jgi:hypothetical protein